MLKKIKYILEYVGFLVYYHLFRLLPFDIASNIGAFIGKKISVFFKANQTARQNLAMIFPEKSDEEREQIIVDMWDNLGRNIGEFPHIDKISEEKITVEGAENIPKNSGAIIISAHFGNWEITGIVAKNHLSNPAAIYRKINNPHIDKAVKNIRAKFYKGLFVKGNTGLGLAKVLKKNGQLCLLTDQKMNNGIAVDFMGKPAMTAPIVAYFAKRYDVPIIPVKILRNGTNFIVNVYPEIVTEEGESVDSIMLKVNQTLEEWIRENPAQWFWVHNRWGN